MKQKVKYFTLKYSEISSKVKNTSGSVLFTTAKPEIIRPN